MLVGDDAALGESGERVPGATAKGGRLTTDARPDDLVLPVGAPPWLAAFVRTAAAENATLRANGAEQAATARQALLVKLLAAAAAYLDADVEVAEAARLTGRCEETIRRAARTGALPARRASERGRFHIRRGDLQTLEAHGDNTYDPDADARDVARHRGNFP